MKGIFTLNRNEVLKPGLFSGYGQQRQPLLSRMYLVKKACTCKLGIGVKKIIHFLHFRFHFFRHLS